MPDQQPSGPDAESQQQVLARNYVRYARAYLDAARGVREADADAHHRVVRYQLVGHAIETGLRGYCIWFGTPEATLRRLRHDLGRHIIEAQRYGFGVSFPKERLHESLEAFFVFRRSYAQYDYRFPNLAGVWAADFDGVYSFAASLVEAVERLTRQSVQEAPAAPGRDGSEEAGSGQLD